MRKKKTVSDPIRRAAAAAFIGKHVAARIRALGAPAASLADPLATSHTVAEALVNKWGDAGVSMLLALVYAESFMTIAALAKAAGVTVPSAESFWRKTLKTTHVLVRREGDGEPQKLHLFKHGVDRFFMQRGTDDLGNVVEGGIRLKLNTERPNFVEGMTVEATTRESKATYASNYEGAVEAAERGTKREKAERDRLRASLEDSRRSGTEQTAMTFAKTGTDAE